MGLFSDGPKGESPAIRELVESARRRLKENPADAGAVLKLADALAGTGRKTEAVRILNRYGPIVQSRGRLEAAIAIYKKASQLDPDSSLTSSTYLSHLQLQKILDPRRRSVRQRLQLPRRPHPAPSPARGPTLLPRARPSRWRSLSRARPPAEHFRVLRVRRDRRRAARSSERRPTPLPLRAAPSRCPSRLRVPSSWGQKKEAVHGATIGIPLLRDIPPLLIDLVLQRINLITLAPGEVLFREGSEGNSVFFVVQGTLAVTARHDLGTEVVLRIARDGDVHRRGVLPHRAAPLRDRDGPRAVQPPRARPQRARAHRPQAPPARRRAEPALRGAHSRLGPRPVARLRRPAGERSPAADAEARDSPGAGGNPRRPGRAPRRRARTS